MHLAGASCPIDTFLVLSIVDCIILIACPLDIPVPTKRQKLYKAKNVTFQVFQFEPSWQF